MPNRASVIRRWAMRRPPPEPRSIVELIRDGTLDPELAAQLWLLVGGRVPIVVAAEAQGAGKSTLLRAVLDFLPPEVRIVELAGEAETFEWLPQASELGWPGTARPTAGADPVRPETTVLLASELSDHLPIYTWGPAARVFVRAASIGYGWRPHTTSDTRPTSQRRPRASSRPVSPVRCQTRPSAWTFVAASASGSRK